MKNLLKSSPHCWHREKKDLISVSEQCVCREIHVKIPLAPESRKLSGTRILFFTDTHFSPKPFRLLPGGEVLRGSDWAMESLSQALNSFQPDHLIFGGDLAGHLCSLSKVLSQLAERNVPGCRLAVAGNWEMMRLRSCSSAMWKEYFRRGGCQLLQNEETRREGIRFYGMDDYRFGVPLYHASEKKMLFQCVIAHNPDSIPFAMDEKALAETDLILCGHTHGGQIRLPGFGAIMTSSLHWKKFEYGLYLHENGRTRMFVSAGMGVTWFRKRLFCPPEIVLLELI